MNAAHTFVPTDSLSAHDCKTFADVLGSVGDKWTIMTVGALSSGSLRYNELQRRLGASQRMLTLTLKRLEADGIVTRTVFPSVPPRVDYALTELGHTLRSALIPLQQWASQNEALISVNRGRNSKRTGAQIDLASASRTVGVQASSEMNRRLHVADTW